MRTLSPRRDEGSGTVHLFDSDSDETLCRCQPQTASLSQHITYAGTPIPLCVTCYEKILELEDAPEHNTWASLPYVRAMVLANPNDDTDQKRAQRSGMCRSHWSDLLVTRKADDMMIGTLARIARGIGCQLDWLLKPLPEIFAPELDPKKS